MDIDELLQKQEQLQELKDEVIRELSQVDIAIDKYLDRAMYDQN